MCFHFISGYGEDVFIGKEVAMAEVRRMGGEGRRICRGGIGIGW